MISQIVEEDLATIDRHQKIDRLEQRRLSRTGRSDETDHFVGLQLEVHVGEHREIAERLGEPDDPEATRCLCHELIACRRRRTRWLYQSVKRATGMLTSKNRRVAAMYPV